MGCDIHIFTESLYHYTDYSDSKNPIKKQKWVNVDYWRHNERYTATIGELVDPDEPKMNLVPIYRGRDYELFSILADVRNYGDNEYISQPKGLPVDVTEIVKMESESWGCDGHSHNWLTLYELIQYDITHGIVQRKGYVPQDAADKLDRGESKPEIWCGWASDDLKWVYREWTDEYRPLKTIIENLTKRYIDTNWLYDKMTEEQQKEIRIVFWFDN